MDDNRPEDWIASTVEARNPGMSPRVAEGITRVRRPDGTQSDLRAEIIHRPEHWLGPAHVAALGGEIGFLAKLLDSSIRLHIQAHPTAAFARQHLDSPYGKLETYVILGVRPGCCPYVLLGFKHAPSRGEWRRIIAEQDLDAMQACLHRLEVRPGEVWLVPGGVPHAIGEGVLMLEVMEPSDWVVRCEFTREGIVVPPAARFMGRDLDFCLDIFDYRSETDEDVRRRCRIEPRIHAMDPTHAHEILIGPEQTSCFEVRRLRLLEGTSLPEAGRFRLLLVTSGAGNMVCGGHTRAIAAGSRLLMPAAATDCRLAPTVAGEPLEIVMCLPGRRAEQS